jgi:hypothetical protein
LILLGTDLRRPLPVSDWRQFPRGFRRDRQCFSTKLSTVGLANFDDPFDSAT